MHKFLKVPDRVIKFKVFWTNDNNETMMNMAYRVQHNNALGVYKGGLRFHPSVNEEVLSRLAYEQSLKNAISGYPLGGAKGGSDFDPKGKSQAEIKRFTESFMRGLYPYIGEGVDVPATDLGVSVRELGFMYGEYKRLTNLSNGTLTAKNPLWGGLEGRSQATGFGLVYITDAYLKKFNKSLKDKKVIISGSGNVALHAALKALELGALVVGISDSKGYLYDEKGLNIDEIYNHKYIDGNSLESFDQTIYFDNSKGLLSLKADIFLPCAKENEVSVSDLKGLIDNGVELIAEGANLPLDLEAMDYIKSTNLLYIPGKMANTGGVIASCIEMRQNATYSVLEFSEVDQELKVAMERILSNILKVDENDLLAGANSYAENKIISAMIDLGYINK